MCSTYKLSIEIWLQSKSDITFNLQMTYIHIRQLEIYFIILFYSVQITLTFFINPVLKFKYHSSSLKVKFCLYTVT
jgi:hypothetical protein